MWSICRAYVVAFTDEQIAEIHYTGAAEAI